MGAQSRTGCRRIGLDGITLVQPSFFVDILKQVPQGLYVGVMIRHIRTAHVYPIAHFFRQLFPFFGVFHHLFPAGGVIFFYRHRFPDVFFGNPQHLFHTQFNGQPVGIPSRPALYPESFLRLIPTNDVFNGPCHYVVNARHSVGGRRSFKKDK